MTYRQLLAAVERAKELEREWFWARDREAAVCNTNSKAPPEQQDDAEAFRRAADAAFDAEIDFDV